MQVRVNGEPKETGASRTIRDLLRALAVDGEHVVVERNGDILEGAEIDAAELKEGDALEVIRFVGGG